MEGYLIISHSRKFVFIKTRKTAGSSIQKVLWEFCDPKEDEITGDEHGGNPHVTARVARQSLGGELWKEYFTFAFERNPWDKCVSLYWWCREVWSRGIVVCDFQPWLRRSVKNHNEGRADRDYYLPKDLGHYCAKGRPIVNYIGTYENLDFHFRYICRRYLKIEPPTLPHLKSEQRPKDVPYQEYYTEQLATDIGNIFFREIELFGYRFKEPGYVW